MLLIDLSIYNSLASSFSSRREIMQAPSRQTKESNLALGRQQQEPVKIESTWTLPGIPDTDPTNTVEYYKHSAILFVFEMSKIDHGSFKKEAGWVALP
jgi:hypothetical protein